MLEQVLGPLAVMVARMLERMVLVSERMIGSGVNWVNPTASRGSSDQWRPVGKVAQQVSQVGAVPCYDCVNKQGKRGRRDDTNQVTYPAIK
jgi:hypothetical protein